MAKAATLSICRFGGAASGLSKRVAAISRVASGENMAASGDRKGPKVI
jgi:hypothetical protein